MADEKALKDIAVHEEVIGKDGDSPLLQIREKEIEISGRILAAKQQADDIVADARKEAADLVAKARDEGDKAAREEVARIVAASEQDAAALREGVGTDVAAIDKQIKERSAAAVETVVGTVTQV